MDVSVGDELYKNRSAAVFLLGQIALSVINSRDYLQKLLSAFKLLAKQLLETIYEKNKITCLNVEAINYKIALFQAIGKFHNLKHADQDCVTFVNDIILYIVYQELDMITNYIPTASDDGDIPDTIVRLVSTIISLLVNDVKH